MGLAGGVIPARASATKAVTDGRCVARQLSRVSDVPQMIDGEGLILATVETFGLGVQAWTGRDEPVPQRFTKPR